MFSGYANTVEAVEDKEALRRAIAEEIKAFKKSGNKIKTYPLGLTKASQSQFNGKIYKGEKQ